MSTIMPGTPTKLSTPTDLGDKARQAITLTLNPLIADTFALYVKTKNFHWHVSGPHFRDYHLFLDEHAEQIFAMIDVLAERVRKLGGMTIRSIGEISKLQKIKDDNESYLSPKEMFKKLIEDTKEFIARLRHAHKVCSDSNDAATESVLEVYIDEAERRLWFLFETLQSE